MATSFATRRIALGLTARSAAVRSWIWRSWTVGRQKSWTFPPRQNVEPAPAREARHDQLQPAPRIGAQPRPGEGRGRELHNDATFKERGRVIGAVQRQRSGHGKQVGIGSSE